MTKQTPVAFLHIPKTGGITFREILKRTYPDSFRYCESADTDVIASELATFKCIELHRCQIDGDERYTHQYLMLPEYRDILRSVSIYTLFREPVDHYLSLFSWVQYERDKLRGIYQDLNTPFPETLDEFIETAGGNHALAAFLGRHGHTESPPVTSQDLDEAKRVIEDFDVILGTLDRFDDFVAVFRNRTGSRILLEDVGVLNRNPQRTLRQVGRDLEKKIREVNQLDVELFDFVRARIDKAGAA